MLRWGFSAVAIWATLLTSAAATKGALDRGNNSARGTARASAAPDVDVIPDVQLLPEQQELLRDALSRASGMYANASKPAEERDRWNNWTIVLTTNQAYMKFLLLWYCRTRLFEQYKFLAVTSDHGAYAKLHQRTAFTLVNGASLFWETTSAVATNTPKLKNVAAFKFHSVLQPLRLGYHVLYVDADMVWWHDPLPLIRSDVDFIFATDILTKFWKWEENGTTLLPEWEVNGTSLNWAEKMRAWKHGKMQIMTGFFGFRSNPTSIAFLEEFLFRDLAAHKGSFPDQPALMRTLERWFEGGRAAFVPNGTDPAARLKELGLDPKSTLTFSVLPHFEFPCGHQEIHNGKPFQNARRHAGRRGYIYHPNGISWKWNLFQGMFRKQVQNPGLCIALAQAYPLGGSSGEEESSRTARTLDPDNLPW